MRFCHIFTHQQRQKGNRRLPGLFPASGGIVRACVYGWTDGPDLDPFSLGWSNGIIEGRLPGVDLVVNLTATVADKPRTRCLALLV